jgi:diguanylate cyclase
VTSRRVLAGYLAVEAVLGAVYFAFPQRHLLLWPPLGLTAVAAILVGIRLNRPADARPWYLFAAALTCFVAGDTIYNVMTDVLHRDNPFPSPADASYLLMYPLIGAGLLLMIRRRSVQHDRAALIDALTVATGLGLLSWIYLVLPYVQATELTLVQRLVSIAYPLGDVLVLALLARLLVGGGVRLPSLLLLAGGGFGLLAADVAYGWIQLNGSWHVGGPVDLGWAVYYAAWGAAGLHPTMRAASETPPAARVRRPAPITLLAVVSLIAPSLMLVESFQAMPGHPGTIAVFSATLYLLVIIRLAGIVSVHQHSERLLAHQAFHDGLTGLPNRRMFHDRAAQALSRVARHGDRVAMLMIDLDEFKAVNDTLGHSAGDDLLVAVAHRLSAAVRAGDTAARLAGDEFAVLFEPITDPAQVQAMAERLLAALREPVRLGREWVRPAASAGLVVVEGGSRTLSLEEMLRNADLALYAAKDGGRGLVVDYHEDLSTRMHDRVNRTAALRQALDDNQFHLLYQPIVALATGEPVGVEALVRWRHPERGVVSPGEFIPLAEEAGLIVELGRWILAEAVRQAAAWSRLAPGLRTSINVSPRQFERDGFVAEVAAVIAEHALPPGSLVLELTENVFVRNAADVARALRELHDLGVLIAIDDFGTGYSSLGYLQQFPIDILKIDRSFVAPLGTGGETGGVLARAVISLGHALRLSVVAEGVETGAQRAELQKLGCTLAQGYLFARPMSAADVRQLLVPAVAARGPGGPALPSPSRPLHDSEVIRR